MSLDIYLHRKKYVSYDKGVTYTEEDEEIYHSNITHNLNKMADAANIYDALWRPYRLLPNYIESDDYQVEYKFEESNTIYAKIIIEVLENGLEDLKNRKNYYVQFNPTNGWGNYDILVKVSEEYLIVLKNYPDSIVITSR